MKRLISLVLMICISLISFSCKCSKESATGSDQMKDKVYEYSKSEFGEDFEIVYNNTEEYALIMKHFKVNPGDPYSTIWFIVIRVDTMTELFRDSVPGARIAWVDDYNIDVRTDIIVPRLDGEHAGPELYIYNARLRKKLRSK